MTATFRQFVPPPGHDRYLHLDQDIRSYSDKMIARPEIAAFLTEWRRNTEKQFIGITTDGVTVPDLFPIADEGAPIEAMAEAAGRLLSYASATDRDAMCFPLDATERRQWANPEIFAFRHGLRLEEVEMGLREAILQLIRASLSDYGYRKAEQCMIMNEFLGLIVKASNILNRYSYNFSLFGAPSVSQPWGWQLFGHHLALNALIIGKQMVMTPCFWGAEPNEVDEGPYLGMKLFQDEEAKGLALFGSLSGDLRARAQLYEDVNAPALQQGRKHPADHLHLAGAGRDNRVIQQEGVSARHMDGLAKRRLLDLVEVYHRHLPDSVRRARMTDIERTLSDCHFCWIGGDGPDDPFYYRIQSPVTIIEFDHHAGVFLTNETAKRFHIHTLMRTPNGNDFGMALVRRHCQACKTEASNA